MPRPKDFPEKKFVPNAANAFLDVPGVKAEKGDKKKKKKKTKKKKSSKKKASKPDVKKMMNDDSDNFVKYED